VSAVVESYLNVGEIATQYLHASKRNKGAMLDCRSQNVLWRYFLWRNRTKFWMFLFYSL